MSIELAKNELKKLMDKNEFDKIDVVVKFLINCISIEDIKDLMEYIQEYKKVKEL